MNGALTISVTSTGDIALLVQEFDLAVVLSVDETLEFMRLMAESLDLATKIKASPGGVVAGGGVA